MDGTTWSLIAAVFAASLVEFVEAFTVVLAMGVTRGWRSALTGAAAAVVALIGFAIAAGYAIEEWIPEQLLQFVIGTLLLVFGLQWLCKAVLRSSGLKSLHDEEEEFARQAALASAVARTDGRFGLDSFGLLVSFKGVFLEGVEIVFIVITFGLNADNVSVAAAGAAAAGPGRPRCRSAPACSAVAGSREHPQVRSGGVAGDVRHVLGCGGSRILHS